ncbi:plasmid stabilization protein [Nitrosomonas communis]|uniref:type II toxin-antitoxin system RelE/ParE family toxin n=1 Tax=Nitrosomonas communis TaxID=44574 RepID=UPI0026F18573|nr:plasmid stabilization protein [Nitrosomonas communis]MCO6428344.1 plasmid stabilization protein [Nitrosomonas communis]
MTWTLVTTVFFERRVQKFLTKHPDLRPRFIEILIQLRDDPFQPTLHLHPLSGKLQGMQAVSLTHSCRIILALQISEHEILLLDIGSHDEVCR